MSLRQLLRARGDVPLARHEPDGHPGVKDRKRAALQAATDGVRLADLQERLWAEHGRTILLVLQGIDTSGKDGTIEHVIGLVNPLGCRITSFKRPTEEEAKHHFLWRIHRVLPEPGQIGVFGRSHYEDVIVPRVHPSTSTEAGLSDDEIDRRYADIARFESGLATGSTTVVKCFLNISAEEQRLRLIARLDDPAKRWKFEEGDIAERARWPQYQAAFAEVLGRSNPDDAPWYVVPADRKWYRNWAVGRILLETLTEMKPEYPQPALDIPALKARLLPPGELMPPARLRAVK